jgi:hypothetical protein
VFFILSRRRNHSSIDQIIGVGIIMIGAMLETGFLMIERGHRFIDTQITRESIAVEN